MIIPVYKKLGESTHLLAKKVGQRVFLTTQNSEDLKATHTGTLDPMAEGVVIVLTGKDRFNKEKLASGKKSYTFEILWGFKTDADDLLGIISKVSDQEIIEEDINDALQNEINRSIGVQNQIIPSFSARRINGESFFDQAKRNLNTPQITEVVEIFQAKIINFDRISIDQLEKNILDKISKVVGDFRQEEIINKWQNELLKLKKKNKKSFLLTKIEIMTSKRFYVRGLVRDLSKKLQIPATTFSIIRTQNGKFKITDCEVK